MNTQKNDELTERLLKIFRKIDSTKEDMLLATGIAFMAGLEKGKEPVKN